MIYDVTKPLRDHRGDIIKDGKKDTTLGFAIEQVLIGGGKSDDKPAQKVEQFKLAQRIARATDRVELSAEEVTRIKELAAAGFGAIAYGSLVDALESPEKPVEVKDLIGDAEHEVNGAV